MSNDFSNHQSNEFGGGEFAAFEQQLKQNSLGDGPAYFGNIMYDCGYAAGAEAGRKQKKSQVHRWRTMSIAASLLATFSLSINAWSILKSDTEVSHVRVVQDGRPQPTLPETLDELERRQNSDFIRYLTHQRTALSKLVRLSDGQTRRGDIEQILTEQNNTNAVIFPADFDDHMKPLRPKDFSLMLPGEA